MRRAITASLVLVALAVAPAAHAKGPTSATITGPGLSKPLRLASSFNSEQTSRYWHLVEGLGFFPAAFGQQPSPLLPRRPVGNLGPKYTIRYGLPTGSGKPAVILQDLYPYAAGGTVTYMAPGQPIYNRKTSGGWFRCDHKVKTALVARGLPAAAPSGDGGSKKGITAAIGGALLIAVLGALSLAALRHRPRPKPAQA